MGDQYDGGRQWQMRGQLAAWLSVQFNQDISTSEWVCYAVSIGGQQAEA